MADYFMDINSTASTYFYISNIRALRLTFGSIKTEIIDNDDN